MSRPEFLTETDEAPPFTDCDRRAFAMLVNHARGRFVTNGEDLDPELQGPRPTYQANGHDPCADNAERLYGVHVDFGRYGWDDVERAWSEGRGVVLHMLYGEVQAPFDRFDPSYTGGHAVYAPEALFVMDPLGRPPYAGQLWPEAMLRHACEAFADGAVQCGIGPVIARGGGDPMINLAGYGTTSSKRILLPAGTPLFDTPEAPPFATLPHPSTVKVLGRALSGHFLVVVATAHGYPDGQMRPTGVYVDVQGLDLEDPAPPTRGPLPRAQ